MALDDEPKALLVLLILALGLYLAVWLSQSPPSADSEPAVSTGLSEAVSTEVGG
jgi:hypothetical protein